MNRDTEEKLAQSLTAETTELLPYLPYLLQDFWELGVDPGIIAGLIERHVPRPEGLRILDLACGKGAVSVRLAQRFGARVRGIDLISEFIDCAKEKAAEYGAADLCTFVVGDIGEAVDRERGYDCVIYGAVGDVLGDPIETLQRLASTLKPGGYLVLDNYNFMDREKWPWLFAQASLAMIEAHADAGEAVCGPDDSFRLVADGELGMAAITRRAEELTAKHPDKRDLFAGYLRSQREEYDAIDDMDDAVDVTWILKKL